MAGELRRCLTRSTIIERVRLPRNGKTAEIVQIATISSKVTMIDKPLKQTFYKTFNKTSKNQNLGEEVIGTNFDNRPITRERKKEICEELGFNFDKFTLKSRS